MTFVLAINLLSSLCFLVHAVILSPTPPYNAVCALPSPFHVSVVSGPNNFSGRSVLSSSGISSQPLKWVRVCPPRMIRRPSRYRPQSARPRHGPGRRVTSLTARSSAEKRVRCGTICCIPCPCSHALAPSVTQQDIMPMCHVPVPAHASHKSHAMH